MNDLPEGSYINIPNVIFDYWMRVLTSKEYSVLFCILGFELRFPNKYCTIDHIKVQTGLFEQIKTPLKRLCDKELIVPIIKDKLFPIQAFRVNFETLENIKLADR